MSAPSQPKGRRRNLVDEGPISFPEPSSTTRSETLPELEGKSDLIADPYGNIFCFVCKVSVPKGSSNITQHLEGKKHDTNNRRFANLVEKEALRERYVKAAEEQRALLLNTAQPQAEPAAPGTPAINSNPPLATAEMTPNGSAKEPNASGPVKQQEKFPLTKKRSVKNMAIAQKHQSFTIDKSAYINSLVADSDDSSSEAADDGGDDPDDSTSGAAQSFDLEHRQRPFTPLLLKPPPGPDLFFESMAAETQPAGAAAKIRSVLTTSTAEKDASAAETDTDGCHEGGDQTKASNASKAEDDDGFIPLTEDIASEGEEDVEEAEREKARRLARQSMHILKDTNGDELPPWLLEPESSLNVLCSSDSSVALHFEILQFSTFVTPTQEELKSRNETVLTVESLVKRLWPSSEVQVFGSYATGLYLPSSDIDICIMGTPKEGEVKEFQQLAQAIRNVPGFARRVNVLSNAKVPLVKIISRKTGMNCDITIGRDNGPKNVPVIKKYLNDYPALRPLLLVIKCFLKQRDLNDPFSGGLGSYSVFLLVVSHLQMLRYNFPHCKANLGCVLQTFFQLYGRMFNLCIAGIRAKDKGSYFDKFEKYETQPHETIRFSIEDPNDETNELGKNGFAAMKVRKAFLNASMMLVSWRRDDESQAPTPLGSILQHDDEMHLRRTSVILDMERKGSMVIRDSITEADPKLKRFEIIGGANRGSDADADRKRTATQKKSDAPNNKRIHSPPRSRDPRERDPRLMKRRRPVPGVESDRGRGTSPAGVRTGGSDTGRGRNTVQGNPNSLPYRSNNYAQANHVNQNIVSQTHGNPTFPSVPPSGNLNPNVMFGAQPSFPIQQFPVQTPGYQYVNQQPPFGANGGVTPNMFPQGPYMPRHQVPQMHQQPNPFPSAQGYGGSNRRLSGKKARGQFQRGNSGYKGR